MASAWLSRHQDAPGKHREAEQAGQNHDERHAHLEGRADDGRQFRGAQILGGDDALHHQEVGGPVAHGNHRAQSEHDADPVDAHRVVAERAQRAPGVRVIPLRESWHEFVATMPSQPPASIRPMIEISIAPSQISTNCSTSLKIAESSPPSPTYSITVIEEIQMLT